MQNDRGDICRKSSFSVKPACMQTDAKAALDNLSKWGNVSALIIHLCWEGGRMRREKESLK